MSVLSVCEVFLRLRAPFFKRGEPVLTLQTGAPLCLRDIWEIFTVFSGGREQQLLERAIVVHGRVLGFIQSQGTETTVFRHRPVEGVDSDHSLLLKLFRQEKMYDNIFKEHVPNVFGGM